MIINWKKVSIINKAIKLDKKFFGKKENHGLIKTKYKTN